MKKGYRIGKMLLVTLVLMLLMGTVSVAAADTVTLSSYEKILYLGGSKGVSSDGQTCETGASKNIANMVKVNGKAFNKKTMTLKLEPKEEGIISVSGTTITGVAMGTAEVRVSVYDKSSKKQLGKTTFLIVTVKKNATSVKIEGLSDKEKVEIGSRIFVCVPREEDGKVTDTDKRGLKITDSKGKEAGYTLVKTNHVDHYWEVVFEQPGTYTVTAYTYQSADYDAAILSTSISVTAVNSTTPTPVPTPVAAKVTPTPVPAGAKVTPTPVPAATQQTDYAAQIGYLGVSQTGNRTFTLNFSKSPKYLGVKAADLDIYYLTLTGKEIHDGSVLATSPKVSGNTVTVTLTSDFRRGVTYYVTYAGVTSEFTAVLDGAEDITKIVINDATILASRNASALGVSANKYNVALSYTCYNALGNKVTAKPSTGIMWELVSSSGKNIVFRTGTTGTLMIPEAGDSATVTCYCYVPGEKGIPRKLYADAKTFTAVEYEVPTGDFTCVLTSGSASYNATSMSFLPLEDRENNVSGSANFEYFIGVKREGTKKVTYVAGSQRGYTYSVDNMSVAYFSGGKLKSIKEGTTNVLVKDKSGDVIYAYPVTVKRQLVPKTYKVTLTNAKLNVNPAAKDSSELIIEVFDQFGNPYTAGQVCFKITSNSSFGFSVNSGKIYTNASTGTLVYKINETNYLTVGTKTTIRLNVEPYGVKLSGIPTYELSIENREVTN